MDDDKKPPVTAEHLTEVKESLSEQARPGPTWRVWTFTVLVAIILSVTATLLLGGSSSFRPESQAASSAGGCGGGCCGDKGK
jgi:hypothetical protein